MPSVTLRTLLLCNLALVPLSLADDKAKASAPPSGRADPLTRQSPLTSDTYASLTVWLSLNTWLGSCGSISRKQRASFGVSAETSAGF